MKNGTIDKNCGFSLVELMIVVAIIAVIAAFAIPSYQAQVVDGRRADCTAVLMQARQAMERFYSKNYTYATVQASDLPAKCPLDGDAEYYTLSISNQTATTYTITADASASQSDDGCGDLTINQAGVKGSEQGTIDLCWR